MIAMSLVGFFGVSCLLVTGPIALTSETWPVFFGFHLVTWKEKLMAIGVKV